MRIIFPAGSKSPTRQSQRYGDGAYSPRLFFQAGCKYSPRLFFQAGCKYSPRLFFQAGCKYSPHP